MTYSAPVLLCLPGALSPSLVGLFGFDCGLVFRGVVLPSYPHLGARSLELSSFVCVPGVAEALIDGETDG